MLDFGLHPQDLSQSGEENLARETCPTGRPWERVLHDKRKLSEHGPAVTAGAVPQAEGCADHRVMPQAVVHGGTYTGQSTREANTEDEKSRPSACHLRKLPLGQEEAGTCWQRGTARAWLERVSGRLLGRDPRYNLRVLPGRRAASCPSEPGLCSDATAAFLTKQEPQPPITFSTDHKAYSFLHHRNILGEKR